MFELKLQQLTEFNEALVYGFEPESSLPSTLRLGTIEETIFTKAPQYTDMLNAYLYAQNTVIPSIKEMG